ncbi:MAG: cytochrome P450 [Dolichospermum sp. DET73]|jgi:cytochrome P450|nr:cytochrome P450 [Dolichospermum sp. DET73]
MSNLNSSEIDYDLFAPEFLFNSYPLYKLIRSKDPVYYYKKGGFWYLTRYKDVEASYQDTRLSSDRSSLFVQQLEGVDLNTIQNFRFLMGNMMVEKDPPHHTQLRKISLPGFLPRALENWRSIIQETTDNLLDIPNGINALLNHPHELRRLKENPELIDSAIEEMIRFDAAATHSLRVAKENLTIGGKEISAGSVVALGIATANHDPEKFENPEVFNITRSPNEHLGFGKGIHFCLGSVLARMELKICFSTLLKRMPNLMFDPNYTPVVKRNSLAFKGFESLRVKF